MDVKRAADDAENGKQVVSILFTVKCKHNDTLVLCLHVLFNICFNNGTVPYSRSKCIINQIWKSSTADPREQLCYRGIDLANYIYMMYCNIVNMRLCACCEENSNICDEQNEVRKTRRATINNTNRHSEKTLVKPMISLT